MSVGVVGEVDLCCVDEWEGDEDEYVCYVWEEVVLGEVVVVEVDVEVGCE